MSAQQNNDGGPAFPVPEVNLQEAGCFPSSYSGMTLRAYAAVKLRVPRSGIDWLDEMIRDSQRDWFAGQALVALASDFEKANDTREVCAHYMSLRSYQIADAMLEARKEGAQ